MMDARADLVADRNIGRRSGQPGLFRQQALRIHRSSAPISEFPRRSANPNHGACRPATMVSRATARFRRSSTAVAFRSTP